MTAPQPDSSWTLTGAVARHPAHRGRARVAEGRRAVERTAKPSIGLRLGSGLSLALVAVTVGVLLALVVGGVLAILAGAVDAALSGG